LSTNKEIAPEGNILTGMRACFNPLERRQNAELKKVIRLQEEEITVLKGGKSRAAILDKIQKPKPIRAAYKRKNRPKAFQLHLSDTHSREIVTLAMTDGRNEHNPEIGRERLRSVILQAVDIIKVESKGCSPIHTTVWGGGDYMVNADLHYKMERCVDDEPLTEMSHVYKMLNEELGLFWSKVPTDSNSLVGSFSNHGRDTEKISPGLESERSYDTSIYRRLEEDFGEIRFTIADTSFTVEEVCGFSTLYTHGHVPGSAMKRSPMGNMIPNWGFIKRALDNQHFTAWVQGHQHTKSVLNSSKFTFMANSSLVGENSYSASQNYPGEPPSQNLAVIDLETGQVEKVHTLYA
jgi:hypothetical protein